MLVGRGHDSAIGDHWSDGTNIVEANDQDLAALARRLNGGNGAEGHIVVRAQNGFEIGMFAKHGGGHVVGLLHLPLAALDTDDIDTGGLHGVLETETPLLSVKGSRNAFDDGNFVARFQPPSERLANLARAWPVVRPDGRHG